MFKWAATALGIAMITLSASPAFAESWWTKKDDNGQTVLARDKDALEAMYGALVNKDKDAYRDLFERGELVMMKPGMRVFILQGEGTIPGNPRYIKVRLKGSDQTYWTTKFYLRSEP